MLSVFVGREHKKGRKEGERKKPPEKDWGKEGLKKDGGPGGSVVKNPPGNAGDAGWADPLEKEGKPFK